MSTETRANKIAIDAKNGERFALVDNGKVVEASVVEEAVK